jgi:hypothetical protein
MAHWAEINEDNVVTRVLVCSNDETPEQNHEWLIQNFGGTWLQTSYNTVQGVHRDGGTPLRGNFAGIGSFYYEEKDVFTMVKPYPSWSWNDDLITWEAPVAYPEFNPENPVIYRWNEEILNWEEVSE